MTRYFLLLITFTTMVLAEVFYFVSIGLDEVRDNLPVLLTFNSLIIGTVVMFESFLLFVLVLCYLPFRKAGLDYEIGIITFNPYTMGLILMVAVCFFRKVIYQAKLRITVTDFFLVCICTSFLVSTIHAVDTSGSGFLAFNNVFIPVVAFYVIRIMIQDMQQYDLFIRAFLLSTTAFAVVAVMGMTASNFRSLPLNIESISAATILIVPVVYYYLNTYFPKPLRMMAMVVSLLALILTFSRIYLLALVLAPMLYKLIKRGRSFLLFTTFFILSLGVTMTVIAAASMLKPNMTLIDQTTADTSKRVTNWEHWKLSAYGRIASFKYGLANFERKPFFGTGITVGPVNVTQHNYTIEWLEYGGLIGYALFLGFFLSHVWRVGPLARSDLPLRSNLLITICVFGNCLSNGLMHGMMTHVIFIMMGLSEVRARLLEEQALAEPQAAETAATA